MYRIFPTTSPSTPSVIIIPPHVLLYFLGRSLILFDLVAMEK